MPMPVVPNQFEVGAQEPLVSVTMPGGGGGFDVTPDGQRFLVNGRERASQAGTSTLTVLLNWAAGLSAKK